MYYIILWCSRENWRKLQQGERGNLARRAEEKVRKTDKMNFLSSEGEVV
jgi:hypothetical protein